MGDYEVVVIGAGLSGLSAARLLSQKGLRVVVLEATDRVGGRTHTLTPKTGEPPFGWADVGASYVGPTQYHLQRLCEELGVESFKCSDQLDSFEYTRGCRYSYEGVLPHVLWRKPLVAWDMNVMLRRLEQMCWEVPVDKPWEARRAEEWDQMTVKDFYDKHCWTRHAKAYFCSTSNMDVCGDERQMSMLFYLWYIRQANGPRRLWGVTGGGEEGKFIGGSQQIANKMAEQLGESVKYKQPVVFIQHSASDVIVRTMDNQEYKSKYVILAIPPVTQLKIHFEPALPVMRTCLLQRSPMGMVMKCVIFYLEPFWEKQGFNGYVSCTDGIEVVGLVTEDVKPGGQLSGLICFVYLNQVVKLLGMSNQQRQDVVCRSLAKFYKSNEALKPVHFVTKAWPEEQYVCGGYTCHYPPGVLTSFGPALRAPIGSRVFLAGTETATHWIGYMNGAIDAGQRAAREVLHAEGQIVASEIWVQEPSSKYQLSRAERLLPSIDCIVNLCRGALVVGAVVVLVKHCSGVKRFCPFEAVKLRWMKA